MGKKIFLIYSLIWLTAIAAVAQSITGRVTDARTGEPLPFVNVMYEGGRPVQTNSDGRYSLAYRNGKLRFSIIGYDTKTVRTKTAGHYDVTLTAQQNLINEAVVTGSKRGKYSRKNNPAVELMRRVIAAKDSNDIKANHDYTSIDKYSKMTFAFNEVTDKVFEEGKFKNMPFLKEHVETCNETGKLILPISVDEMVSRNISRKNPAEDKTIILGQRNTGMNDLFSTGDILTTMLAECFTEVNIYKNTVRLLRYPFISPLSSTSSISFYRFFIEDTTYVAGEKCIRLDFTPNNPQDFGFSGSLYILADSTYRVKRADLGIPYNSDVNFVENMRLIQDFDTLPTGEHVLVRDNMLIQLRLVEFVQKFQVKRTTEYTNFSFDHIPDKEFRFKGNTMTDANALIRDDRFWQAHRTQELTRSEDGMELLLQRLQRVKGFKAVLFVGKALIENFVETSTDPRHPSKVDIGPVNTMISQNTVDGLRLRLSAQTTANLNPHLFLKGYAAYGFKDGRWKGLGEVTYSFNRKGYLPREFPVNNLTFTYSRDVMSASDKYLPTDKDNVFVSFKWTDVDHMMYYEYYRLQWDREWDNGLRLKTELRTQRDEPTKALFYQSLDGAGTPSRDVALHRRYFRTSTLSLGLTYQPGVTWINTKQRRIATNRDAPVYGISHTSGIYEHMGRNYVYHTTEANIYKRFWLRSWGKIDALAKGGVQWSRVPFPLLVMPAANLSYVKESNTFELIDNMEFMNDRYAQLMLSWNLNGKIFNRIPLLKRLKWREFLACNVLWGTLTDKNNPLLERNAANDRLYYFPGKWDANGNFRYLSTAMDPKKPYVEVIAGIHNIFKLLHVEYVRRLTYTDRPGTKKWGIRFMLEMSF